MSYKILHFADLHLDASFAGQGFPVEYGNERRLDLRAALTRIFAHARELKVNAITIGGDLFVQEYLLPETADFIQQQFSRLHPIRVIISPGREDPYTNESPYSRLNWPENVDIFYQGKLAKLELTPAIHLWGASNPPVRGQKLLDGFQPSKGVNILLVHAVQGDSNGEIHAIHPEAIRKAGLKIALLGGEHVAGMSPIESPVYVYPGSPEPLSSSEEQGLHQLMLIDVDEENIHIIPLSVQQWHYQTIEVDVTNFSSNAEAARRVDKGLSAIISKTPQSAITVKLIGKPYQDLNLSSLRKLVQTTAHFQFDGHFELSYDLEQLAREQTVRGLLVQRFIARIENADNEIERRKNITALNFALQALDGKLAGLYEIKAN